MKNVGDGGISRTPPHTGDLAVDLFLTSHWCALMLYDRDINLFGRHLDDLVRHLHVRVELFESLARTTQARAPHGRLPKSTGLFPHV